MSREEYSDTLRLVVQRRLVSASLIAYEHNDDVNTATGELELLFEGGACLHLACAGDGEGLVVSAEPWRDAFAPPLSPENEAFVRECGKHVRVSATTLGLQVPVGDSLRGYRMARNQFGTIAGLALDFSAVTIRFVVECDESYVMGADDPRFEAWGFTEDLDDPA
jgi:hypothetical protein